jgi:hypothetical protein
MRVPIECCIAACSCIPRSMLDPPGRGPMDLGIATGTSATYSFAVTRDYQIDNLTFDVATPSVWLMIAGLGGLGAMMLKRKAG